MQDTQTSPAHASAQPQYIHPQYIAPARQTSGMAIASMILGIFSVLGGTVLGIPMILALVFGHKGLKQCKDDPSLGGRGMAITGLVLGYLCLFFILSWLALIANIGLGSAF